MNTYEEALAAVLNDDRYQTNLAWGRARPGHPEGTIGAHIEEISHNLDALAPKLSKDEYLKLALLVHTHDTFKGESQGSVAIRDPRSHASIARAYLQQYVHDEDLLNMVQLHDEPFALWRQVKSKGSYNRNRFDDLLKTINDWDVFVAFQLIDGCTAGKSRDPLRWLFTELEGRVDTRFSAADIL